MTMDFKDAAWNILIANGGVVRTEQSRFTDELEPAGNYYGSGWEYDFDETVKALELMEEHGIDFDKMGEPHQDQSYHFNGTFTDHQLQANHLWGVIYTGGQEFYWAVETEDLSFSELLGMLTKLSKMKLVVQVAPLDIRDSIARLRERVDEFNEYIKDAQYRKDYWSYKCKL